MSKEISESKQLEELLCYKVPHIAKEKPAQIEAAQLFCEGYKTFLDKGKTERECVVIAEQMLLEAGYSIFDPTKKYKTGDKVYYINRKRALIATTIGKKSLKEGARLNGAHIDSPRLDLKPNPLFEKSDIAYLKPHYYGGIRKYQWATIPLAMHGVVVLKNGETVNICIGEDESDPVFCISDLLPHLAQKQNQRKLADGILGEELNIIVGTIPFQGDDVKEPVKLMALKYLNDKYGMTEVDFLRAEIQFVPAGKAKDIGFDRGLVGAYGQDDRVCGYTALVAEIESKEPTYTTITILADKEEIGSDGNTGLNSDFVKHYMEYLAQMQGVDPKEMFANSICLSSDVNAAFDPTFPDVFETNNTCYLNKGCVLTKYTGTRGKSGSSDASAELMAKVISIMDEAGVYWQIGELGKVDQGGGGTIAKYVAHMNIDVVDLGVPIMSMHAPFEISSKLDIYNTYKAFEAFYQ